MARKWNDRMRDWLRGLNEDASCRAADWLSELSNRIDYEDSREIVHAALTVVESVPALAWFALGIATDPRVSVVDKLRVGLVTSFLLMPYNQILNAMMGPMAYLDDAVLIGILLFLIGDMMQKVDERVLMDNWVGDETQGEQIVALCRGMKKVVGLGMAQPGEEIKIVGSR